MTEVSRLWNNIPDAWRLFDHSSRAGVEGFWSGMAELVIQLRADLHRVAIDPLVEYARPDIVDRWHHFDFSDSPETLSIDATIITIPTLQDRIDDPETVWRVDTDYTVAHSAITWKEGVDRPDGVVWAPRVFTQNERVHQVLGELVDVDLDEAGWDSRTSLDTVRCLWYCYQHGPTMDNVRSALNAMLGLPMMAHAGRVTDINEGIVTVAYGDSVYGLSDHTGHVICGDRIEASASGTVAAERRLIQSEEVQYCRVDDWVVPTVGEEKPARRIVGCHEVTPVDDVLGRQTNGATSADGHTLTGGGDWSLVEPGDLLQVLTPPSLRGTYKIDQPLGDGAFFQRPLTASTNEITYIVERASWVEVHDDLDPGNIAFGVVRPSLAWVDNMWVGSNLVDAVGGVHAILNNRASVLTCPEAVAGGALQIQPNFAGDTTTEEFAILPQASVLPDVDDYLRRFAPLLDGVRVRDWREDDLWARWHPPILPLTADGGGTNEVTVGSTAGIPIGQQYLLQATSQATLLVTVARIRSSTVVQLDQTISASYSLANLARLAPTRRPVEGLSGFFVVKEGSSTGAVSNGGRTLTDSNAQFTEQVRAGDWVRIVSSSGTEGFDEVDTVQSDTELSTKTDMEVIASGAYYQIVKPYVPGDLSTLHVDISPYHLERYNKDMVEGVLKRFRPSHVEYAFADEAIEVINIANNPIDRYNAIVEMAEEDPSLIFEAQEPRIIESTVDGMDTLDHDFIVGPKHYQWAVEEYFRATLEHGG